MMKTVFALCFLALLPVLAQAQRAADSAAITTVLKDSFRALAQKDSKAERDLATADYLLIEDGEVMSLQEEIDRFFTGPPRNRADNFTFRKVWVEGNTAYAVYNLKSEIRQEEKVRTMEWNESAFFRKEKGRWKLALLHSSPLGGK